MGAMPDRYTITTNRPGQLPRKVPGEHRWIATAMFNLADPAAFINNERTSLDHTNVVYIAAGCWDCERPLTSSVDVTLRCPSRGEDL